MLEPTRSLGLACLRAHCFFSLLPVVDTVDDWCCSRAGRFFFFFFVSPKLMSHTLLLSFASTCRRRLGVHNDEENERKATCRCACICILLAQVATQHRREISPCHRIVSSEGKSSSLSVARAHALEWNHYAISLNDNGKAQCR